MIHENSDGSKTAKAGRALIHLENLPGGVCAWTFGALRPTFVLRNGQHVQLAQFYNEAAACKWLADNTGWEIVVRIDEPEPDTEEGQ